MKQLFTVVTLFIFVAFSFTSCSLFAPKTEDLTIDSDPQGAEVVIPGRERMTTPCTINVPCDKDIAVIVRKSGYNTKSYNIRYTLGKCGILDVCGTALWVVPAVGLFTPGAYTLEQHTIFAPLDKSNNTQEED